MVGEGMSLPLWRFLRALVATNLRSALALRGSFWLSMLFMVLNNLAFFVFWWVLLGRVEHVRGWRIADLELLFGISAASFGLAVALAGGVVHLSRFIEDGTLDPLLCQPKPTLLYALGLRCQASGFGDLASGMGMMALSGHLTWHSAPRVLLCTVLGAVGFVASGIVFFSLAFWLKRSHSLSRWLLDVTITFSLYPEALFSGALKLMLYTVLPAGIVAYLPLRVIREASLPHALLLLLLTALYLRFALWVFGAGLKRYSSGSRFGVFG